METIIKGDETYYDLEIRFGEIGAIIQSKDDNKHPAIGFSIQQALQLAAALTERYGGGEWKPIEDKPTTDRILARTKGGKNGDCFAVYKLLLDEWHEATQGYIVRPTHYQIIQP